MKTANKKKVSPARHKCFMCGMVRTEKFMWRCSCGSPTCKSWVCKNCKTNV